MPQMLVMKENKEGLELLKTAIAKTGYTGKINSKFRVVIGMDVVASEFYEDKGKTYDLKFKEDNNDGSEKISGDSLKNVYKSFVQIVGDDLLVTNPKRVEKAIREKSCNALLLKVNQIGSVTESIEAARMSKRAGWDFEVQIKIGAPCPSEDSRRVGSNNCLCRSKLACTRYFRKCTPKRESNRLLTMDKNANLASFVKRNQTWFSETRHGHERKGILENHVFAMKCIHTVAVAPHEEQQFLEVIWNALHAGKLLAQVLTKGLQYNIVQGNDDKKTTKKATRGLPRAHLLVDIISNFNAPGVPIVDLEFLDLCIGEQEEDGTGKEYPLEAALEDTKNTLIQGITKLLLDFRVLDQELGLILKLRDMMIGWIHEGF
ncbi:unnamed protein product [Lactuca virosa]|uniref:phosphopyruvate hydratase n=1 Tax=Lactuca virosa TaxID=75947 RepID=A0AAU9LSQ4_9ASTR|nr:unnamed protein product [Lactuca virosa]